MRLRHDGLEIVSGQRFTARQTQLHRTEGSRLPQHTQPVARVELRRGAREVRRVVAENTVQGTPVGELQQQPQRRPGLSLRIHQGICSHFFSRAKVTKRMTSADRSEVANARSRSTVMSAIVVAPSQRFKISPALVLSLIIPSG